MEIPEELLYTEDHEWVAVDQDVVTVGITDFSQRLRGEIDCIDLPGEGVTIEAGRAFAVIHAENSVADVYAPVTGEVIEVNEELTEDTEMISLSPYEDGWMIKVRMQHPDETGLLLDSEGYSVLVSDLDLD